MFQISLTLTIPSSISDHPSNIPDSLVTLLKENQGIILVTYNPIVLKNEERIALETITNNQTQLTTHMKEQMIEWQINNPSLRASIDSIVQHIDRVKQLTNSCKYVGISSGFDHNTFVVKGAETSNNHMSVIAALLQKGYTDECIKNIIGLNMIRVFKEVETVSATLSGKSQS